MNAPRKPVIHLPVMKAGFRLRDLQKFVEDATSKGYGPDDYVSSPGKHQTLHIK